MKKKELIEYLLIIVGAICFYALIWYNRTMPIDPRLKTAWSDAQFEQNYGSDVLHEFFQLNLKNKDIFVVKKSQGFHLFSGKQDPRIVAVMSMQSDNIHNLVKILLEGRENKYKKKIKEKENIYFYDFEHSIIVNLKKEGDLYSCSIKQATVDEWEHI